MSNVRAKSEHPMRTRIPRGVRAQLRTRTHERSGFDASSAELGKRGAGHGMRYRSKRYPVLRTVRKWRGELGSSSSLRRSSTMCVSIVRLTIAGL